MECHDFIKRFVRIKLIAEMSFCCKLCWIFYSIFLTTSFLCGVFSDRFCTNSPILHSMDCCLNENRYRQDLWCHHFVGCHTILITALKGWTNMAPNKFAECLLTDMTKIENQLTGVQNYKKQKCVTGSETVCVLPAIKCASKFCNVWDIHTMM